MTENVVDEVARARIDAHEKECYRRMERVEDMFGQIKIDNAASVKAIWDAIDTNRERAFNVVLKLVPWTLGGMGIAVIGLIGYIAKGVK